MAVEDREMAFHAMLRGFLTVHLPTVLRLSPGTVRAYANGLNSFRIYMRDAKGVGFMDLDFCHFTGENIASWLDSLRGTLSTATLNLRLASAKVFLRYCSERSPEHSELLRQALEVRRLARQPGEQGAGPDFLTAGQLKSLFMVPDAGTARGRRDRFFMILAFETGARLSELLALTVGDIINDQGRVSVLIRKGKGGKSRVIPVTDGTARHLRAYLGEFHPGGDDAGAPLFYTSHRGGMAPMHPRTVAAFLSRYGRAAAASDPTFPVPLHCHMFRHSLATAMVRRGVPISIVRDLLGHASIDTTMIYARSDPEQIRRSVEEANEGILSKVGRPRQKKLWKCDEDELLRLTGLKGGSGR